MLKALKNNVTTILDNSLLCLDKYRTQLDNSAGKEIKEITLEHHIFSGSILGILTELEEISVKLAELICGYDAENDFSKRDSVNTLLDTCISFRKSVEAYMKDCEAALKNPMPTAVYALINHTDILTRKILFLKSNL